MVFPQRTLLAVGLFLLLPAAAFGQDGRVAVAEENLRAAPDGVILASVLQDTELRLGARQGQWREATLEGWIWDASVAVRKRDGHDLAVTPSNGENLRAAPNGAIIARLRQGMLLDEIERSGRWVRVRRTAWIWEPSLRIDAAQPTEGAAAPPVPRTTRDAAVTPRPRPAPVTGYARPARQGVALLAAPDRDTIATLNASAPLEVLARDGNWTRVRMEGWIWTPALAAPADTGAVLKGVTAAALAEDPQRYQGRLIEWSVQFIALEFAEKIRTDFYEGEPFILARGPGDEVGFVYLAVPPDRLEQVRSLTPLQRITVVARVRTPRSALMDAPVLDLLRIP